MKVGKNEQEEHSFVKIKGCIRNRYFFLLDFLFAFAAYFISVGIVDCFSAALLFVESHFLLVFFTAVVFCIALYISGVYSIMWIYSGTRDYLKLLSACLRASVCCILFHMIVYSYDNMKMSVLAMFLLSGLIMGARMAVRGWNHIDSARTLSFELPRKKLLIVGAGTAATIMLRDMDWNSNLNYEVVGFIDDDPAKKNARVNGIQVLGDRSNIQRICRERRIDEILIALPSASRKDRKEIIEICNETACKVKILPSIDQAIERPESVKKARNIQIEDLLTREPVKLDNKEIRGYIEDKVVIVTGGGGSIGSELCRQIMRFSPKKLVVLDIYENNAYELQMELNQKYPNNKPDVIIGSVRDMARMEDIFEQYRPSIVFHAAAHKHVPLMEDSPGEAIKNNVFGTLNVAKCSSKFGVKRFVMISTDKAVNPTNIMGATKRICEMIVQCMQQNSQTEFAMVRFGNVLGSNGSVIPLFKKQIEQGGPVTVTDKRITRFFMTIPEAAQLVLQAASYAKGGEIFVLDMGEPVKIYDLARNLIKLSGYQPDVDIQIEFCGLRPGEKLYEELLMDEEGLTNTNHQKIFIGKPIEIDQERLEAMLAELDRATESNDPEFIKDVVEKLVPTYERNKKNSDEEKMVV